MPKQYSSKAELKSIAVKFAEKKKIDLTALARFLLEVDRLKSVGVFSDVDILIAASKTIKASNVEEY
jgi:hypothetical protein